MHTLRADDTKRMVLARGIEISWEKDHVRGGTPICDMTRSFRLRLEFVYQIGYSVGHTPRFRTGCSDGTRNRYIETDVYMIERTMQKARAQYSTMYIDGRLRTPFRGGTR